MLDLQKHWRFDWPRWFKN